MLFRSILDEGPFSSWDLESGEVVISAESFTTLGVPRVVGDALFNNFLNFPRLRRKNFFSEFLNTFFRTGI